MLWKWLFGKRAVSSRSQALRFEPIGQEEWEARLIESGVSSEWAPLIAGRLADSHANLGRGSSVALIEGAILAVEVQAAAHADVERNMKDVREVERLLGAFSGELEKLDEVLEVLAAYAQRMRAKPAAKPPRRFLH
jgi:hypothetical protein